ncbi:MAG: MFS transporter [Aquabacterium sp.]|uniref:MFS transporter n=1 Tax=Aquabacterium sp. TaxID=1872578 RepID=UPI0025BCCC5D|nr:MFS transporter [Aquabacterium sp.]MBI5927467.1 MFS transporter [Aquabacterium sp.]
MSAPEQNSQGQRVALLTGLYTAQGIPFGFFTLALPVLMRDAGWSLTAIGFLQFLALPWGIKFLWAPALDHHGSRRSWLLFFQCSACLMALILSQLDLKAGSLILFAAVFLFNMIAASQDVVTDGLSVRLLGARERGLANAIQVGAYRLGMVLGGGLLLWIFAREGWQVMFLCMAGLLALTILPVLPLKEPPAHTGAANKPQGLALVMGWLHRALAPGMLVFFGLIFCFRFGDQILNSLLPPFLLDHGVSKSTIALMKGGVGSATSLLGASIGGWLVYRLGRRKAMLLAGLSQAAGFGLYVAVAFRMGGVELLWAATILEGIVGTMATVALFTLMMDASDPNHAGTDYTLLASVVVAVSSLGSLTGGVLGDKLGYGPTFLIATGLAIAGTLFVVWWLDRHPGNERIAEAWR